MDIYFNMNSKVVTWQYLMLATVKNGTGFTHRETMSWIVKNMIYTFSANVCGWAVRICISETIRRDQGFDFRALLIGIKIPTKKNPIRVAETVDLIYCCFDLLQPQFGFIS